jgi:photosynthetic reaction center cytochrome c subunit
VRSPKTPLTDVRGSVDRVRYRAVTVRERFLPRAGRKGNNIMRFGSMRSVHAALGIAIACLVAVAPAIAQTAPQEKPQMVEDVFKNVQVLKGIPVNQFMDTMGFFAAALGLNCTGCHVAESLQDWNKFADDVPRKRIARQMILMVNGMNKANFGGRRALTCWSCHRGTQVPEVIPSLAAQYTIPPEDANQIEIVPDGPTEPTADQVLDKFIQALGGAQRLAGLTSFAAKGTVEGYDTYHMKVPVELYAKAPGQRALISHTQNGDTTTIFDGRSGWVAAVDKPVRLLPLLPGAELDGAKLDADLCFPAGIKQALNQWSVGFPVTAIDDKPVNVIQGRGAGGTRFKLYFDVESGLLTRQVRYADTPIGMVPTQVDYANYREVAGVKMPFRLTVTWTDGQSIIELTDVQPNVAIDSAKFAKPAPAAVKPQGAAR